MRQNLFLVLLETHEVKVKVFNAIFFEEVLSDQTAQIDAIFAECIIFIQTAVSLYRTEVASVIAHV